jgi:hypothetical protein
MLTGVRTSYASLPKFNDRLIDGQQVNPIVDKPEGLRGKAPRVKP